MAELVWFDGYGGESVGQLLALEGRYRTDSIVLAFEQAMDQKAARVGSDALTFEERAILAIEALEREVNNGGYSQFFVNTGGEYDAMIVEALRRIGCPATANVTQRALTIVAGVPTPIGEVKKGRWVVNENVHEPLYECDKAYDDTGEAVADRLLEFIKANKGNIRL
jgi:hypothetical protein